MVLVGLHCRSPYGLRGYVYVHGLRLHAWLSSVRSTALHTCILFCLPHLLVPDYLYGYYTFSLHTHTRVAVYTRTRLVHTVPVTVGCLRFYYATAHLVYRVVMPAVTERLLLFTVAVCRAHTRTRVCTQHALVTLRPFTRLVYLFTHAQHFIRAVRSRTRSGSRLRLHTVLPRTVLPHTVYLYLHLLRCRLPVLDSYRLHGSGLQFTFTLPVGSRFVDATGYRTLRFPTAVIYVAFTPLPVWVYVYTAHLVLRVGLPLTRICTFGCHCTGWFLRFTTVGYAAGCSRGYTRLPRLGCYLPVTLRIYTRLRYTFPRTAAHAVTFTITAHVPADSCVLRALRMRLPFVRFRSAATVYLPRYTLRFFTDLVRTHALPVTAPRLLPRHVCLRLTLVTVVAVAYAFPHVYVLPVAARSARFVARTVRLRCSWLRAGLPSGWLFTAPPRSSLHVTRTVTRAVRTALPVSVLCLPVQFWFCWLRYALPLRVTGLLPFFATGYNAAALPRTHHYLHFCCPVLNTTPAHTHT